MGTHAHTAHNATRPAATPNPASRTHTALHTPHMTTIAHLLTHHRTHHPTHHPHLTHITAHQQLPCLLEE